MYLKLCNLNISFSYTMSKFGPSGSYIQKNDPKIMFKRACCDDSFPDRFWTF